MEGESSIFINNISHVYSNEGTSPNESDNPFVLATYYTTYKIGEVVKRFYFPVFVPIGIVGNVLSFLVMIQPQNRKMSFSLYISALAVADTMVVVSAIPTYLFEVLQVDMPPNEQWFCRLQLYNFFSSFLCSCYLLITMTFERFYSIIKPHKAASFNTVKKAKRIIIIIFITCFTFSIPYLFISGYDGAFCVPILSNNALSEWYHWLTEILIFIFPFLSLLTMNSIIIRTLRKRSKLKILELEGENPPAGQNAKNKNPEKQVITTLLLVTFVFLILNIPIKTMVFYLNFYSRNTPSYYASLHLLYQVGQKAFYTNHGINFFLYVISGQKFKTDLRNMFMIKK